MNSGTIFSGRLPLKKGCFVADDHDISIDIREKVGTASFTLLKVRV